MPRQINAAVLTGYTGTFTFRQLALREPVADEVLVEIAGCGICHTDIKVSRGYASVPLPVVLGHEGAGRVLQTGPDVDDLPAGEHVVISFPSCGLCPQCLGNHPAYCDTGQELSFSCKPSHGMPVYTGIAPAVSGGFFGQSSFATHAIVSRRNLVRVDRQFPLALLGPLGCGFQTGAGAILNVLQPKPASSLVVIGAGNVGLSAVMAAGITGLEQIIAIDSNTDRLQVALALGATHVIDTTGQQDIRSAIAGLTSGTGANYILDTTNEPTLIRSAFSALANRGTLVHSGGGGKDISVAGSHLLHGRSITGVIQGDSNPQTFIPQLLDYYRQGRFPFDRLLQSYALEDINQAIADMRVGKVIKPVLLCQGAG
jgi:aryl-alcohol dehydrogenase